MVNPIYDLIYGKKDSEIERLSSQNKELFIKNLSLNENLNSLTKTIDQLKAGGSNQIKDLQAQLDKQREKNALEIELNSKYPSVRLSYPCRWYKDKKYTVDVRNFFTNPDTNELQDIVRDWKDLSDDDKALKCLQWVIKNITYTSDDATQKRDEYWQYSEETLQLKKGDCEDGGILMANLMLASGIPYYKIRINAGNVNDSNGNLAGGHCYTVYYCEKLGYWVTLDWCFYPNQLIIQKRPDYKSSKMYGGELWFSFNSRLVFKK